MDQVGPTVFLDACVLYSIVLCDALLTAAKSGLLRPTWSREVEAEWLAAAARNGPHSIERLVQRRDAMRRARPDWEAVGRATADTSTLDLPDPADVHVIEAAMAVDAEYILTLNLRDFPDSVLSRIGIRALHPDTFLSERFVHNASAMFEAFELLRQRLKRPPLAFEEFLDNWTRHGLSLLAARLKQQTLLSTDQVGAVASST
ncbi:MAG: PIN domain-containing protein [Rubrivivax sp.]|nr:MAG: PIN domain-containing protein [Rubrivivax sp.]